MRYTISEMASLLGVTTHTLRYYEKMGLIHPEVNEDTGYRYYTVTDTRRFNLCRELRAAGFTLEECKDFLDEPSTAVTDAMLDRQIRQLERRQVLNRMSIRFLQKTREYYHTLEQDAERAVLRRAVAALSARERQIMELRFGLADGVERTQKEAADALGISY